MKDEFLAWRKRVGKRLKVTLAGSFLFLIALFPGYAISFQYSTTDLADTTPGADAWRYTYYLSGFAFQAGQGFTIFFNESLFTALEGTPASPNADWDVISVQPDFILSDPGFYDGLALVNLPSLADPFSINFVYLGAGTPGSQPFDIYDANFTTIVSGVTVPYAPQSVPDQGTGLLGPVVLMGMVAFAAVRERRGRKTNPELPA